MNQTSLSKPHKQNANRSQQLGYDNLNKSVRSERHQFSQHQVPQYNQIIDQMEQNLTNICQQHDALMPLLGLLESMPLINKNEACLKGLQKNQTQLESKLTKLERQMTSNNSGHVFGSIERNFKTTNQQIGNMRQELKDIQNNISQISKLNEAKLREESNIIYRNVDVKLEKNRKDIQNILAEFKNDLDLHLKKKDDKHLSNKQSLSTLQINQQSKLDQDNQALVEAEINNVYKELGMLKSEIEVWNQRNRSEFIKQNIEEMQTQGLDFTKLNQNERNHLLLQMNQNSYIDELQKFDQDNNERILQEMNSLNKQIQNIQSQSNTNKSQFGNTDQNSEIQLLDDKFFNLKQQIHGTKKKYLVESRKIESNMDDIKQNDLSESDQYFEEYQNKIDSINANILKNIDRFMEKQDEIQQKLDNLKEVHNY